MQGKDKGKEVKEGDKKGASPPEPSPIAAAIPPRTPGGPTLRQAAAIRAQRFISQYFGTTVGGQGHETEGLKLLKEICSDLGAPGAVERLLNVLRQDAGAEVSTFEFLSSGAVKQLRQYLLGMPSAWESVAVLRLHMIAGSKRQHMILPSEAPLSTREVASTRLVRQTCE